MTLHVCKRCDGPCQCDPGLLENEARRWEGHGEPVRWPLCDPSRFAETEMACRVQYAREYSDREKVAHVKACGKACKGDFWYRHDYLNRFDPLDPRRYAVDPLDDRYPRHQIDWDDARWIEGAGGDAP